MDAEREACVKQKTNWDGDGQQQLFPRQGCNDVTCQCRCCREKANDQSVMQHPLKKQCAESAASGSGDERI